MSLNQLRGQWRYLASRPDFQKGPIRILARLFFWRLHCLLKKSAQIRIPKFNLLFFLPPHWRGPSKIIYVFRNECEPEIEVLTKFLGPGKTMIDVGASYGIFSLVSGRLVGETGTVLSFEPAQATYQVLERNLAINHLPKSNAMRMALSDKPGKLRLYHDADSSRNSLAHAGASEDYEEVEVRTLDSVVQDLGLTRIDFIKIDAEGADEQVCRGASEILKKFHPPVFFEQNQGAASQLGLEGHGTAAFLASLGYEFHVLRDGEIIKSSNLHGGNILALHKG